MPARAPTPMPVRQAQPGQADQPSRRVAAGPERRPPDRHADRQHRHADVNDGQERGRHRGRRTTGRGEEWRPVCVRAQCQECTTHLIQTLSLSGACAARGSPRRRSSVTGVRTVTQLGAGGGVSVEQVQITAQTPRWSEPEAPAGYRLMLVRQGAFGPGWAGRYCWPTPHWPTPAVRGWSRVAPRTGDARATLRWGTAVRRADGRAGTAGRAGAAPRAPAGHVGTGQRRGRRGRASAGHSGPPAGRRLRAGRAGHPARGRPAHRALPRPGRHPAARHRRRPATSAPTPRARPWPPTPPGRDWPTWPAAWAAQPHHLSRLFHRQTGMTLTRYRRRLLVLAALDAGRRPGSAT